MPREQRLAILGETLERTSLRALRFEVLLAQRGFFAKLRCASFAGLSPEAWAVGNAGHAERRALVDEHVRCPGTVARVELPQRGHVLLARHQPD